MKQGKQMKETLNKPSKTFFEFWGGTAGERLKLEKMIDVAALMAWSPEMYILLDRIRKGEAVEKDEINEVLKWIDDAARRETFLKERR